MCLGTREGLCLRKEYSFPYKTSRGSMHHSGQKYLNNSDFSFIPTGMESRQLCMGNPKTRISAPRARR